MSNVKTILLREPCAPTKGFPPLGKRGFCGYTLKPNRKIFVLLISFVLTWEEVRYIQYQCPMVGCAVYHADERTVVHKGSQIFHSPQEMVDSILKMRDGFGYNQKYENIKVDLRP